MLKINLYLIYRSYLLFILNIMGRRRLVLSLVFLEILSWVFIIITTFYNNLVIIKYIFLQGIFVLLVFMGYLLNEGFLYIAIMIKLGFPPFHNWVFVVTKDLSKHMFRFFLTFHKILPILILRKFIFNYSIVALILMSSFLLPRFSSLRGALIFSSLIHTVWILIGSLTRLSIILLYWTFYSGLVYLLVFNRMLETSHINKNQDFFRRVTWYILSGIPPFIMFWIKVLILKELLESFESIRFLVLIVSVLTIFIYFRFTIIGFLRKARLNYSFTLYFFLLIFIF